MGCLFGCFRAAADGGEPRGSHGYLVAASVPPSDPKIGGRRPPSKNALSAVFLREDEGLPTEQIARSGSNDSAERKTVVQELKCEASFLKNCGALPEIPNEIQKEPENMNSVYQNAILSVHSGLPAMSDKLRFMEELTVEGCQTPSGPHQSSSLPDAGSSTCKGYEVSSQQDSDAASKHLDVEGVKDESVSDTATNLTVLDSSPFVKKDDNICFLAAKSTSFLTPLEVNDEMQTPATAHPATLAELRNGENTRIHAQHVYPVLSPVKDFENSKMLREESCQPDQSEENFQCKKNDNLESVETSISDECSIFQGSEGSISSSNNIRDHMSAASVEKSLSTDATAHAIRKKVSKNHDSDVQVPSLSQWLKPPNPKRSFRDDVLTNDRSHSGKSSEEERPIIGMVAAHWKDKEPENITPKWWDGNGIPNSTNKYKEDQKVSWHATPFEERLEKALSDEKLLSQRKCSSGKTSEYSGVEGEESDTAASNRLHIAALTSDFLFAESSECSRFNMVCCSHLPD